MEKSVYHLTEKHVRLVNGKKIIIGKLKTDYDSSYYVESGDSENYDQHYFHSLHVEGVWKDCIFLK